jgi:hypothetical protein
MNLDKHKIIRFTIITTYRKNENKSCNICKKSKKKPLYVCIVKQNNSTMKTTKIILITTLAFGAIGTGVSCKKISNPIGKQDGFRPIYKPAQEAFEIKMTPARAYKSPGKINQYGNYTLQLDVDNGIHIIDCSNPVAPKKIGFIQVPGCSEIAIHDDVLFVDNYSDLVSIKINAMQEAVVEQRVKNAFVIANEMAPPKANTYFECVDVSKGPVIKWVEATLENPNCKTL